MSLNTKSATAQNSDSLAYYNPKIGLNIISHVNPFRSLNLSYESFVSPRASLEIEAGYIYRSVYADLTNGLIFKLGWKPTLAQFNNRRFFYGAQLEYQYDYIRDDGVLISNDMTHFRQDKFERFKHRSSALLMLGYDFLISRNLYFELSAGLGLQYIVTSAVPAQKELRDDYSVQQLSSFFLFLEGEYVLPDTHFGFKLKYNL